MGGVPLLRKRQETNAPTSSWILAQAQETWGSGSLFSPPLAVTGGQRKQGGGRGLEAVEVEGTSLTGVCFVDCSS